jgi:uncharacterized protein YfdQ (DUF2303 family)
MIHSFMATINAQGEARQVTGDPQETPYTIVPDGYKLESLEAFCAKPISRRTDVLCLDEESFIHYVKLHKTEGTVIFYAGTAACMKFTAIFDFEDDDGNLQWRRHTAEFRTGYSPEWIAWQQGEIWMAHIQFAEFLEEQQRVVINPPGAELLELVQTLEGHKNARFEAGHRLQTGARRITLEEDIKLRGQPAGTQKGQVDVPSEIQCGMPLFIYGPQYKVVFRLKYRIADGQLAFRLQVIDKERLLEDAVRESKERISRETELFCLAGALK